MNERWHSFSVSANKVQIGSFCFRSRTRYANFFAEVSDPRRQPRRSQRRMCIGYAILAEMEY